VIAGRYDTNSAPVNPFRVHKAIAGSRFVVFAHSGHLPLCEEPEMFLNVVESFLA
jgi:pimeloyl-ACP methyl ester carboxylesterase